MERRRYALRLAYTGHSFRGFQRQPGLITVQGCLEAALAHIGIRAPLEPALEALRGEPLTVYGDGSQTRSLCFVSDLVDGIVRAMEAPSAREEVINLGNPDERTVLEVARLIAELTGAASNVLFTEPAVADDPQRRRPDITKAGRLLGWKPRVPLHEGLGITIAYFRDELAAGEAAAQRSRLTIASIGAADRDLPDDDQLQESA